MSTAVEVVIIPRSGVVWKGHPEMTTHISTLVTAKEFEALGDIGTAELVRGKVVHLKSVTIRGVDGTTEEFTGGAVLRDEFVLPGFALPLRKIFARQQGAQKRSLEK